MPNKQKGSHLAFHTIIVLVSMVFSATFGSGACNPKPKEITLPFETIEQNETAGTGMLYEDRVSSLMAISSPEEAIKLSTWISDKAKGKLQEVDYNKHFVLAVFHGWKPNTGYSVEVYRVTQLGNTVNVYVQFHEPEPDEAKADVEISPYHLVQVQKFESQGREITFNLLADETVVFSFSYVFP